MTDDNETPEAVEEAPKRRGRRPKVEEAAPAPTGGLVKVRVTHEAVHDGKGGKFYAGAEIEVTEDVAEVWLSREWAELL